MSVQSIPIAEIPEELIAEVFSYLDARSLAISYAVSKQWNRIASGPQFPVWERFPQILLKSELLARVQQFADKLQFGQNAIVHCPFLKHPGSSIHINCISGNLPLNGARPGDPRPTEEMILLRPVDVNLKWFFLDTIGFGPDTQMYDLKLTKSYYVSISAWLPAGQIDQRFVERLGKIVTDRMEYLR